MFGRRWMSSPIRSRYQAHRGFRLKKLLQNPDAMPKEQRCGCLLYMPWPEDKPYGVASCTGRRVYPCEVSERRVGTLGKRMGFPVEPYKGTLAFSYAGIAPTT